MTSLRKELIASAAQREYERQVKRMTDHAAPKLMLLPDWDELTEDEREYRLRYSADYLDSFLDVLEAKAEEWSGAAARRHPFGKGPVSTPKTVVEHAVAVLREDESDRRRRLKECVENWPEAVDGGYDPRCCRFPKSCSCTAYSDEEVTDEQLEVVT